MTLKEVVQPSSTRDYSWRIYSKSNVAIEDCSNFLTIRNNTYSKFSSFKYDNLQGQKYPNIKRIRDFYDSRTKTSVEVSKPTDYTLLEEKRFHLKGLMDDGD